MTKQRINCVNPATGKRAVSSLDVDTNEVTFLRGIKYKLSYLKKCNKEKPIGFFETFKKGKVIDKTTGKEFKP